ncbi:MAG TPA: flagellar basal body-associated FliL family protein [Dissulfurispiraceae bacterium]|nr:flagellar basal body-associated FliL family protein [Dissulfurispiraceae bacterium]
MAEKEADQDKEGAEEAAPKKGSKKMLIIIIVAVVAVVLAVAAFFIVPKFMGGGSKGHKEEAKVEEGVMFSLDPFVVNLNDPGGPKFLKVSIQLELANAALMEKAKQKTPQLRDAIITLLTSKSSESLFPPEGKLQLKDEINARMNQIMGPNLVKNVYLTDFVMQ